MLTCLNNWIGVKGCTDPLPLSGFYINDLPGVDLRSIDQIANDEQVDFQGVFDEIQKRAVQRFDTDIRGKFAERWQIKTLTQSIQPVQDVDTATTFAPAAEYRGILKEFNNVDANVVYSNLLVHSIQTVQIYSQNTQAGVDVKVFDADLGTELFTTTATLTADTWVTVQVNQSFTAKRIFICYDATLITSYSLNYNLLEDTFCNCSSRIKGATSAISPISLTTGEESYGLTAEMASKCSYEGLVCNNKECFTQALLYLLGMELMTERIYSDRLNRWTTTDLKSAKELRKEFHAKYKGGIIGAETDLELSVEGELDIALNGLNLDLRDCCLQCNEEIIFKDANL